MNSLRVLIPRLLVAAFAVSLTGCSGGGHTWPPGTGPGGPPTSVVVYGTVKSSAGADLSGYTVTYDATTVTDPAATLTATTNSQGVYSITVPYRDITGTDSLYVYDTLGGVAAVQSITLTTTETTANENIVVTGPPTPPAGAARGI